MSEDLGRVVCRGETIEYTSTSYEEWRVCLDEVAILGELVTEAGPDCADHFWILVCSETAWHSFPVSAEGESDVIESLAVRWGNCLSCRLLHCASLTSAVVYPPMWAGKPLFVFHPVHRGQVDRILRFWKPDEVRLELTDELKRFLLTRKRPTTD